jgi:hypothetical protein
LKRGFALQTFLRNFARLLEKRLAIKIIPASNKNQAFVVNLRDDQTFAALRFAVLLGVKFERAS